MDFGYYTMLVMMLMLLLLPLSTYGTRAFSVAGPVCWKSLPDYLKSSDLSFNCFRRQLKHFYFVNIDTSPSTTLAH